MLILSILNLHDQLLAFLRVGLNLNNSTVATFEDQLALDVIFIAKVGFEEKEVIQVAHHYSLVPVFLAI